MRCAAATSTPELAVVSVLRIEAPIADALVLTHRTDGSVIGRAHTDAEGCAQVPSEPGALLTVQSGRVRQPLITTTAPAAARRTVRIPAAEGADCMAGRIYLDVQNPPVLGQGDEVSYAVSAGCDRHECIEVSRVTEPVFIDIPVHLLGDDGAVHLWIRECVTRGTNLDEVVICRDAVAFAAPGDNALVTLGEPVEDLGANGGRVEVDGQRFAARVTDTEVATHADLPFDHVAYTATVSPEEYFRAMQLRWAVGARPPLPGPDDYLPALDGGAWLDDNRTLRLPAPSFAADAVRTELAAGSTRWHLLLPAGLTPITLPDDPELPTTFAQGVAAMIYDELDHPDHEAFVAGGLELHSGGEYIVLDIPVSTRLRSTVSRLPD